ncbi:MAG TPA: UbiA family prenyltransferase [Terracidiphilus sp.]|jgi:4-hydroxybenzoate polyprenyltransferase
MKLGAVIGHAAGSLFANRVHVFVMPAVTTYFVNQALNLPLPFEYYLMICLTTAGGYIYNLQTDTTEDAVNNRGPNRVFGRYRTATKLAVFVSFFIAFLISLRAGWKFALYGILVNLLFSLYSRPLAIRRDSRPLRIKEVPFLKNVYCAMCWSVALVLTPYVYLAKSVDRVAIIVILICFGLNYVVELLWDIRDTRGDALAGFRTVPLVIGESGAFLILRAVHVLTCALAIWKVETGVLPPGFLVAAIHLPVGLLFSEWYRRLPDKEWASHLYIVYAGVLLLIGAVWNLADYTRGVRI